MCKVHLYTWSCVCVCVCVDDADRGFVSMIHEWLKGSYEEKKLYPCWRSVLYALTDSSVDDIPAANTVAKSMQGMKV